MSTISMMELNAKSPFIWDWENLVMPNNNNTTKVGETPRKLQLVDSDIDGIEGFEVGSFYSSGGRSDNGTGSDLGYASSSKSSKSASIDSCPERGMKGNNNFILETTRTSSNTIESSAASGESLIALELGKRTFFEDVFAASNTNKTSGLNSIPPNSPAKKSKPASISTEIPRCQVEGCNLDLSSAKDYHRKHRVCEDHSKSPKVVINGLERRFCQQCSRFHSLSEFDQKKRSCRRRLSDHNARRRKPKPDVIQFNSMRMAPSLYEGRNQLNFGFNQVSVIQASQGGWCNSTNSKDPASAKQNLFTIMKSGSADELHSSQTGLQASEADKLSSLPAQLLPSKGSPSELFQHGLAVSMAESELDGAQDIRALSLLSTTSWGSSSPFEHSIHRNGNGNGNGNGNQHPSLAHPVLPIDTLPISNPSPYWQAQAQQPPPVSPAQGSHLSTFQLFKSPTESTFYLY